MTHAKVYHLKLNRLDEKGLPYLGHTIRSFFIEGLLEIQPPFFSDERGVFLESYHQKDYFKMGISTPFVQDNLVYSHHNVLRGLHYSDQAKLVLCLKGKILDVAVDLRKNSPTFGKWVSIVLEEKSFRQFYIPQGFLHGYLVLSPFAMVHYKVSSFYDPLKEGSIRWDDPDLAIDWGIQEPILSQKDRKAPFFQEAVCRFGL